MEKESKEKSFEAAEEQPVETFQSSFQKDVLVGELISAAAPVANLTEQQPGYTPQFSAPTLTESEKTAIPTQNIIAPVLTEELLEEAIWEHLQDPTNPNMSKAVGEAKKGTSVEIADKQAVDDFYVSTYSKFHLKCASKVLQGLLDCKSHEEAYKNFGELYRASLGMKGLGYSIREQPKYPDFIFEHQWILPKTILGLAYSKLEPTIYDVWRLPDTENENAVINEGIRRIFAYLEAHPPANAELVEMEQQEMREFLKEALRYLNFRIYINAIMNRDKGETVDVAVGKADQEFQRITQLYGFELCDIQHEPLAGITTSAQVLEILRPRMIPPKLNWDALLVLDKVPRPIKNVNSMCYAIATLQCLANFLPLWRLTAMRNKSLAPSDEKKASTRLNRVFELLNEASREPLDVSAYLKVQSLGDPRVYVRELFDGVRQDGLIVEADLNDFVAVFVEDGFLASVVNHRCIGGCWNAPCYCEKERDRVFARGGLVLFNCSISDVDEYHDIPGSVQFMDLEQQRYVRHDLYGFTFGGDGHCIAYVKRRNGKWYHCNDSLVEEIAEDGIPFTRASQALHGKFPLLLFYLRVE